MSSPNQHSTLAELLARKVLALKADERIEAADAIRSATPFDKWAEPARSDAICEFLAAIGEPQAALIAASSFQRSCSDPWSGVLLAWAQAGCHMERHAIETLKGVHCIREYRTWAEEGTFRMLLALGEFERAATFLTSGESGVAEQGDRMARWLESTRSTRGRRFEERGGWHKLRLLTSEGAHDTDGLSDHWTCHEKLHDVGTKLVRGDLGGAAREARLLTRVAPQYPSGWCLLGAALSKLHELDRAEEAFGIALELCPSYSLARFGRAQVRFRRRRFHLAALDAEEVVRAEPMRLKAHAIVFRSLMWVGRFRDAWHAWRASNSAVEHALRVEQLADSYKVQ